MNLYSCIRFSGYKVFPDEDKVSLDNLGKVNVIIGKNNSGKSSLLDVIEMMYGGAKIKSNSPLNCEAEMMFERNYVDKIFRGYSGLAGYKKDEYVKHVEGKTLLVDVPYLKQITGVGFKIEQQLMQRLSYCVKEEISNNTFLRLSAERDIIPEADMELELKPNGSGASNIIRAYLNNSDLPESIIEDTLLLELNKIMMPDAEYENIRIQEVTVNNENLWEIFLQEKGRERVPLSKSGSGLKTVILMLLMLHVVTNFKDIKKKKFNFGFEELENNLHPAMQRRIFEYLYDYAEKNDVTIFLTTHSHVAINTYYGRDSVSIYHVVKKNGVSKVNRIDSYIDKKDILDDLDVKASDILQANGIIWAEGPSDRIYIKRWLEIFTENSFTEGKDYQFLFYGGRVLSHYAVEEETKDFINILKINRNSAIVIDSDMRKSSAPLNETKKRIIKQSEEMGIFCWVTAGKEIENYITKAAISDKFEKSVKQCGKYELFPEYLEKHVGYFNFSSKKVPFARDICSYIKREDSRGRLDLYENIERLYKEICKWNGIE